MTIAIWMILGAWLTIIVSVSLAKGRKDYDNRAPRSYVEHQPDEWRRRAYWAHQNGYENLPLFIAGVLIAEWRDAPQTWVDTLAVLFVLFRLGHLAAYVADKHVLRSLAWTAAIVCTIGLFVVSV
ncbi:MAG: hypothetical protein FJX65_12375 [Alphaproteobacteria bacterium]|nr:hypothetical protein [Alphaproteobacteria bacterium]